MVVDTSAVVAIMVAEPGAEGLAAVLDSALAPLMSAATRVELGLVLEGRDIAAVTAPTIEAFLRDARIRIIDVDRAQVDRALEGWRRFGKGRHPAGLNFGDCFTYALASTTGNPILCTGNDFALADVEVVPFA